MPVIERGEISVKVDDEGYLLNFKDWNEEVASVLAEREGIKGLVKDQMDILNFIRDYYERYSFFPVLRAVCKNLHQPKDCVKQEFMSPVLAWKISGLPKPDEVMMNLLEHGETPT